MRISRDHVPQAPKPTPAHRLPEAPEAVWIALAVAGSALVVAPTDGFLAAAAGAILVAVGCHRIGFLAARRGIDPRIGELTRERDHWKALADWAGRQLVAPASGVAGPAPGDDRPAPAAAAEQPRPSAGLRGGGRPGSTGDAAALRGLDAPLPGEDGGLTE